MRGKPPPRVSPFACVSLAIAMLAACSASADVSRELGALCEDRGECDDRCLVGARYPGGFCSVSCDGESDCPGGSSCTGLEGGVCLFACSEAAECDFLGTGWSCRPEPARGGSGGEQVMVCAGPG